MSDCDDKGCDKITEDGRINGGQQQIEKKSPTRWKECDNMGMMEKMSKEQNGVWVA